jgi:hypothetical protein
MNETTPTYQRLPGVGRGIARRTRLWLGPDHLLQVTGSGVSEEYQRFYFRDIQAFVVGKTDRGKIWNLVWGVSALIMGLWALGAGSSFGVTTLSVLTGCCLLALAINIALGSTARCELITAVHREEIPSLRRWNRAGRVLSELKPLIEAEQGSLRPDMMPQAQSASRPDPDENRGSTPPRTGTPTESQ